jgi:MFS family permease
VIGFALFGALTYLPLFQQIVRGASPTESGLQLVPVMAGVLVASIASGQIITRTGRYKAWPIAGTATATVGMVLLSTMDQNTSTGLAAVEMLVLGLGLGMVMQVLVLAVQNAVPYEQLGVATSGATLFRSIGGSIGTAILGTVFTNRLDALLASGPTGGAAVGTLDPSALDRLPAAAHHAFIAAFTDALGLVFTVAACVIACAFLLSWLLEERPLRTTVATAGMHEAFATPEHPESVRTVALELSRLVGREGARDFVRRTTTRSGLDISPLESWVLVRTASEHTLDVPAVAETSQIELDRVRGACHELHRRGLLTEDGDATGLTQDGAAAVDALAEARRGALVEMAADWEPETHPELVAFIERLSADVADEAPRAPAT